MANTQTTIPLSRIKIIILLIGGVLLIGASIFMVVNIIEGNGGKISIDLVSSSFSILIGVFGVLFFGVCISFMLIKLFDRRPGLIIDEFGITDHSNATSVGLIEWEDITGFRSMKVSSTKILIIETNQPEKYIQKAKNSIAKMAMKANNRHYGSPLSVISNSLAINFDKLERIVWESFDKYKK